MTEKEFENKLHAKGDALLNNGQAFKLSHGKKSIAVKVSANPESETGFEGLLLPLDYCKTMPDKVLFMIDSKLGLNKTIFARQCQVKKVERVDAEVFLNRYHLMGSTQSGFNTGLFYKDELVALASFSKGRKMNRLAEHQRSYELIRFCCKGQITVTGGLTRLVKNFCIEKQAGDIMTYIDKQLSDGGAFIKAGFKIHSHTAANYFLVDKKSFQRKPLKDKNEEFDSKHFYLCGNCGNIKLVYTPPLS